MSERESLFQDAPLMGRFVFPFRPLWRWLTNPRVRETRRMTKRGYTLEGGSDGRTFWN